MRSPMVTAALLATLMAATGRAAEQVDYNRDIRPLLSNNCFTCHGPDADQREAELRLDTFRGATQDRGGYRAIEPGDAAASALIERVTDDGDLRMPPAGSGRRLTETEIDLLRRWIRQGARYAAHWSYAKPVRPPLPAVSDTQWPRQPIDYFVLSRLADAGLRPSAEADRQALVRRLSLDLTGLPPTLDEVDAFVNDPDPDAYTRLVERLLRSSAYGERWAAMWLDLARYADSAGYANDPPRTIWLYRDWVIQALNNNQPFDQFTVEQLAGDLLRGSGTSQQIATAFHRNTLTNSEGGTSDEEFRNVALVDRVNTTLQVWMGTTIGCAQCHNHKYDPISQEEYYRLLAFFNQTADSDRADEQPLLEVFTEDQREQRRRLEAEIERLRRQARPRGKALADALARWEADRRPINWTTLVPTRAVSASGVPLSILPDGSLLAGGSAPARDTYTIEATSRQRGVTAVRLEALTDDSLPQQGPGRGSRGGFVVSELQIEAAPLTAAPRSARFVRLELPGQGRFLHVAEVEVFSQGRNVARGAAARQSSTAFDGPARLAVDGNTDGTYANQSVSHTAQQDDPWWEVDLGSVQPIERVVVWNRTDNQLQGRLDGFVLSLLDDQRHSVWKQTFQKAPPREEQIPVSGAGAVALRGASATATGAEAASRPFDPSAAVDGITGEARGWGVLEQPGIAQTWVAETVVDPTFDGGTRWTIRLHQQQGQSRALGRFRLSLTGDRPPIRALPREIETALGQPAAERSPTARRRLEEYYLATTPPPREITERIAALEKQIAEQKPVTVPVMRELPEAQRRTTNVHIRGNFLSRGAEVSEGVPQAFHDFPEHLPRNRLGLARWLVDPDNPLTARVVVNRYWEQLFGAGLVRTSEDFGVQGELPTHPALLDWLAAEFVESGWDVKHLLKRIVTSATYRQSSAVSAELLAKDPYNRLLSRGPRFRLSAEMVRDQALQVSGLLSRKMYGPSVQPPRPQLGLRAAFGGSTDWSTSGGGDRYRRGLYTSWRRSLPYPSMATFDAPSRNVCTIRRIRTNTPLQALVTLNDPVYVEAAQALARRMVREGGPTRAERASYGFRLCLARPPRAAERDRLVALFEEARRRYAADPEAARQMASDPLGPLPAEADAGELAAWTVVGNVLLNLDETLAKR